MKEKTIYWSLRHKLRGDLLMEWGKPCLMATRKMAGSAFVGEYSYDKKNWRIVRVEVRAAK